MSGKRANPLADRRLAGLWRSQHGVAARRQLLALGVIDDAIDYALSTGRLYRVHRAVYSLTPPQTLKREGHWMAAVLACGPGAVLSHAAAGALWDLRRSEASIIDVTVPGGGGRQRRKGIRIHRSLTLTPDQCTIKHGIPVTTPARTLIDLADRFDRRSLERAADGAETQKLFDLTSLLAAVEANRGRRGARALERLLEEYTFGANLTESELEDEFFRLCDAHGILRPEAQAKIGPHRVDFLWREEALAVETDSWRWHGGRSAWERDGRRDIYLQRRGLRVVRVSYLRVFREPYAVADDLHALLKPQCASPSTSPMPASPRGGPPRS